ncbi:MAG: phosphoglucosamine mutase [Lachnospiraceae bacterium]|nr:phosphoglucosamine mutase [Lachnospiraceae bacterium]
MGKYFGTDGFRGKAGGALNAEHAYKIGRFLGWYYGQNHTDGNRARIVIGKDTRRSSYMFENALSAGITASGADAFLLHVTTTPSVSFITRDENFDCGIMVSASHNPFYDNGIKLLNGEGEKMEDEVIAEVEKYLDSAEDYIPYAVEDKIGKTEDHYFGRNRYIGYLVSQAMKSFENCRVGIDCANGSAWMIGRAVFDALGAKTNVINNQPDGTNVNKNCGSTHIEGLQKYVVDNMLDVGFAFDGDADRCLAVDEKGNLVNGDKIMYICGKYMKERNQLPNDTVVVTVMSNLGLIKALEKAGIKTEVTDVGDKNVYENMKKNGHALGGEESGHIIFRQHARTGDGILTAIMIMNVMIKTQLPLSLLAKGCEELPQARKNVVIDSKEGTMADPKVIAAIEQCKAELGDSGRMLVRPSGTEPVIRVMSEAVNAQDAIEKVDYVVGAMAASGHLIEIKK